MATARTRAGVELFLVVLVMIAPIELPKMGLLLLLAALALWRERRGLADVGLRVERKSIRYCLWGLGLGIAAAGALGSLGLFRTLDPKSVEAEWVVSAPALLLLWAQAAASEIVFRGYVWERAKQLEVGTATALVLAACGSAWLAGDGTFAGFTGAAIQGVGYGILYLAANKNLVLPIFMRGAFETTLVLFSVS